MLRAEAEWLNGALSTLPEDAFPLLNLGSSTRRFREVDQPFINELLFTPLDGQVVHADLKPDDGVDVVLDFTSAADRERLRAEVGEIRSVLCSNMLEHLGIPPREAAMHLLDLVPSGGHLLVSVPERFGYHEDPIDNGYRPTAAELAAIFPGCDVIASDDVPGPILALHHASTRGWLRYLARVAVPFYKPKVWAGKIAWFWRPALIACVLLRKH